MIALLLLVSRRARCSRRISRFEEASLLSDSVALYIRVASLAWSVLLHLTAFRPGGVLLRVRV